MIEKTYILGIILAIIATVIFNLVPILQKEGLDEIEQISFNNIWKSILELLKNKKWVIGTILGVVGGIPYTLALNWVGVTLLQPLMSFGLLVLIIFAKKILNEKMDGLSIFAVILMILLPLFIGLSNVSNIETNLGLKSTQISFWIYIILAFSLGGFFGILGRKWSIFFAFLAGDLFAIGALFGQAGISMLASGQYELIKDFWLIATNLLTDPPLQQLVFYGFITIIVNSIAAFYFQMCMQRTSASQSVPIQATVNILVTVLGGVLIFGQNIENIYLYTIGLLCAISGTAILARYQILNTTIEKKSTKESIEDNVESGNYDIETIAN